MDLDSVAVEIRPRRAWESVDLGFRLARSVARPLWGAFVPVLALFAALACVVFQDSPALAAVAIWWCKPWYDRVALHVLSRAVFGATPRVLDTWRGLPGMFRRGAIAGVLHMRFDAARSVNLSPWQLEEQPWAGWRRRVRLIETPVRATAAWLTVVCAYFELTLVVGLFALAAWLVPPPLLDVLWETVGPAATSETASGWAIIAAWILAIAVVEPLYVAGGFALYLNRRTQLEAWDIEITFRRMAARQRHGEQAQGA